MRNAYGEMRDALNQGLFSDRLQVDWWIRSGRVRASMDRTRRPPSFASLREAGGKVINKTHMDKRGLLEPDSWSAEDAFTILLEIPMDFQQIKGMDMSLARAWRQMTRAIFERSFKEGYQVTEFLREKEADNRRCFYVLEKSTDMYVSG